MPPNSPAPSSRPSFDSAPLAVSSLLALTLFVLVPGHLYLSNKSDLLIFFRDAVLLPLPLALGITVLGTIVLSLFKGSTREKAGSVVLATCVLFWIHSYLLVWPYGILDGADIPWQTYTSRLVIDAALWLMILALAIWQSAAIYRRIVVASLGLIAFQSLSLTATHVQSYDSPLDFFKTYYVERDKALEFSSEKNVIFILLDEFQSDIFQESIAHHETYQDYFDGFTYFPDTVAGFSYTEFAIPAMLTGQIYDNSETRESFLRRAYLENSLPVTLQTAGFDVQLYPWRGFANESIYYHESVATNFRSRPIPFAAKVSETARLLDLSLFRSVPQFAKRFVYNDATWLLGPLARDLIETPLDAPPDVHELKMIGHREVQAHSPLDQVFINLYHGHRDIPVTVGSDPHPRFKFYHLAGLHVPVKMNRDLVPGEYAYTRENYGENAEAWAKIMQAFLNQLKSQGIYDNSLIIIAGDHGSGREPVMFTNPTSSERTAKLNPTAANHSFQGDKARGLPLLLIKRFGATGPLQSSAAPASVIDIPATVAAEVGADYVATPAIPGRDSFKSESLFDLSEDAPRQRHFGTMVWAYERSDFVNPISLYRIEGHSWNDESWHFEATLTLPAQTD